MLIDLVVDSNVLSHAQNPSNPHFLDSSLLLKKLLESTTMLCMDGRFTVGAGNSSLIGQEYIENIGFGGVAFAALQTLMQSRRIKVVSVTVSRNNKQIIDSLVPNNKRDRTFVKVAFNSDEQILASHDFQDFTETVRRKVKAKLGVLIKEASGVHPEVMSDS